MSITKTAAFLCLALSLLISGCDRQSAPALGRLIIKSEPAAGADISLNGVAQDEKTTAIFAALKPGPYDIELSMPSADSSGTPQTGKASIEVKPGRTTRVIINLTRMAITPAAESGPVRPRTRGQKSILDFYDAIAAQDPARAFAHLNADSQRMYGGIRGFTKTWASVESVEVTKIDIESSDPSTTREVDQVVIEISETTDTTASPANPTQSRLTIVTSEDDFGGSGLPRILEIREATAARASD